MLSWQSERQPEADKMKKEKSLWSFHERNAGVTKCSEVQSHDHEGKRGFVKMH